MSRLKLRAQEEDETEILLGPERLFVDLRASDPSILQSSSAKYYITLLSPRRQHLLVYIHDEARQAETNLGIQTIVVCACGDVVRVNCLYLRVPDNAAKDITIGLKDPALNRCSYCIPALVSTRTILGVGEKPTATQPATGAVRNTSR